MIGIRKIWLRIIVVFLIQIIFKSFDLSFPGGPFELNWRSLWFSVYFMGGGLLLWYGAAYLDLIVRRKITNAEGSWKRTSVVVFVHLIFAYACASILNLFYRLADFNLFEKTELWEDVHILNPEFTVGLTAFYLMILGFDNYSRVHNKLQERLLKEEQLKKENISAQYRALKAQIEPHFLFNSLSVLSSLVYENADLSAEFIVKLSKTLRYIIEKNNFDLVKLADEFEFLDSYFFLIKTRLNEGVFLENNIDRKTLEQNYVPPVTLQLLVENAIGHNSYNPKNPLLIRIYEDGEFIVVENNMNPRTGLKESTKQGLNNVSKRYELISEKRVVVSKSRVQFVVKVPLINQQEYESFNI